MAYITLEQLGIILNMIAGVLMGLNFFFREERIDKLNTSLGRLITRLKGDSSTLSIRLILILFIFTPLIVIFLPIYLSNITGNSIIHSVTTLIVILMCIIMINQLIISRIRSIKKSKANKPEHILSNKRKNYPYFGENSILNYIFSLDLSTLVVMLTLAYYILYGSFVQTEFPILSLLSKLILYLILFLIISVIGAFLLLGFLMFSPKGVIGSIGAICLIIGSALQLLSTTAQP